MWFIQQAFQAWLSMHLANTNSAPQITQHSNFIWTQAQAILFAALNTFIDDCKLLVSSCVQTSIRKQLQDLEPAIQHIGKSRKQDLDRWQCTTELLAWGSESIHATQIYALLMNILSNDPQAPKNIKTATEHIGYKELCARIIRMAHEDQLAIISAPIHAKGSFLPAMKLAYILIKRLIKDETPDKLQMEEYMTICLASMVQKMRIQFVPWHKENEGGSTQAHTVDPMWWLTIKRKLENADNTQQGNHT
jgi:rRNA-processing protein FCF1